MTPASASIPPSARGGAPLPAAVGIATLYRQMWIYAAGARGWLLLSSSLLSQLTGAVAVAGLAAVALTIVAFDRAMMRLAHQENRAERAHAAALLDCLSNIATVLSLRLQQATRRLLARRLEAVVA